MRDFYTRILIYSISLLLLFLLGSCSKFDKEEPIPSYVTIKNINVFVPDSLKEKQGSSSSAISDAWIYIDDELQGIYELPAKFPVLKEGDFKLRIRAGIKENGIGSVRPVYPFYTAYTGTISLKREEITEASATVEYQPYTQFDWKENFDGAAVSLTETANGDTAYQLISNGFEGSKSLGAFLDGSHPTFEYTSSTGFALPKNGSSVFLELNYKTNVDLRIGFIANTQGIFDTEKIVSLRPAFDSNNALVWKKVYINLTLFLETYPKADTFKILFRADKPADAANCEFYLDNIKLLE